MHTVMKNKNKVQLKIHTNKKEKNIQYCLCDVKHTKR